MNEREFILAGNRDMRFFNACALLALVLIGLWVLMIVAPPAFMSANCSTNEGFCTLIDLVVFFSEFFIPIALGSWVVAKLAHTFAKAQATVMVMVVVEKERVRKLEEDRYATS